MIRLSKNYKSKTTWVNHSDHTLRTLEHISAPPLTYNAHRTADQYIKCAPALYQYTKCAQALYHYIKCAQAVNQKIKCAQISERVFGVPFQGQTVGTRASSHWNGPSRRRCHYSLMSVFLSHRRILSSLGTGSVLIYKKKKVLNSRGPLKWLGFPSLLIYYNNWYTNLTL